MAKKRKRPAAPAPSRTSGSLRVPLLIAGIALLAVLRSAWATRLDGFLFDEPHHVVAGATYVHRFDYRLNPEHPPLVKLWVGAWMPESVLSLPLFRPLHDKPDERAFVEGIVFAANDPEPIRARARTALFVLNGSLLLVLAFLVRRVFGDVVALFTLLFLAIDPTVAAHLSVVMTDLPFTLLSAIAVLLAGAAFRGTGRAAVVLAGLGLGAALGAKHSALVTAAVVVVLGLLAIARPAPGGRSRPAAAGSLAAILVVAFVVLWTLYGFRSRESAGDAEVFNRPLAEKIADVKSPWLGRAISIAHGTHLLPRAYLWGLADVVRAGVEGRGYTLFAFGRNHARTPVYYFPGVLAVKLPLGLLALAIGGLVFSLSGKAPPSVRPDLVGPLVFAFVFLVTLARSGAGYAGVRHALPVFPALALFAGTFAAWLWTSGRRHARPLVGVLFALAATAVFAARPWEFYNLLAGGTSRAFRLFNDEGIDLGQRSRELIAYYDERLRPSGDFPYIDYPMAPELARRYDIGSRPWQSADPSGELRGTFLLTATRLAPSPVYDFAEFREAVPSERLGNLLVFRGTFRLPWLAARETFSKAMNHLHGVSRDPDAALPMLMDVVERHPANYVAALELGNVLLEKSRREESVRAYEAARDRAPVGDPVRVVLERQVAAVRAGATPPPVQNPWLE